jgi:hypothetical protein
LNNVVIHDTLECFINDTDAGKTYFFGLTDKGDVAQTVTQNVIRSGIGAKVAAVLQSEKNIEFGVTTTFHNDDIYAIQSGNSFTTGTVTVQKFESGKLVSGKITITGTPKNDEVIVLDKFGKTLTGTYATGEVTVTGGTDGEIVTVIYSEDEVSAEYLDLDATKFPKNYNVQLHGIGYDPDTNEVVCDIYWIFDKAMPNGAFTFNGDKSNPTTEEVRFTAQTPIGSNSYGKYVVVPRS